MFRHARAQHGAGKIAANQQLNRTGVTVRRGGFHDGTHGIIALAGNINAMGSFTELRSLYDKAAFCRSLS